ncbi:MAG: N-acetylmuramic acid 6-phosphate etherase [Planctomycetaceae bacterium]|nr:N-acetylmuramic acid 6-phosphate etherase [Planctomycetaceae bacterium]
MNSNETERPLGSLTTEAENPASQQIDTLSSLQIVRLMNTEDAQVATAVADQAPRIAEAIDVITARLSQGGRLLYLGAGTSGRLGVLDASECPPTFNTPAELVVGVIAGGYEALHSAAEGIEDQPETAVRDLQSHQLSAADVLVGIATSGRTPYVIGGLQHAQDIGAATVGLACNADCPLEAVSDVMITPVVGPEVITGSTRLKAGTATKMVLNMLTTGTMVRLGKTYGNLMVDLRATNTKLTARARRLAARLTGLSEVDVEPHLQACDGELKTTVVCVRCGLAPEAARSALERAGGQLRVALQADHS